PTIGAERTNQLRRVESTGFAAHASATTEDFELVAERGAVEQFGQHVETRAPREIELADLTEVRARQEPTEFADCRVPVGEIDQLEPCAPPALAGFLQVLDHVVLARLHAPAADRVSRAQVRAGSAHEVRAGRDLLDEPAFKRPAGD